MSDVTMERAITDPATPARARPPAAPVVQRGGYIALSSPDPGAAAAFAVDHMGLALVHVDEVGRHYLAAGGLDPYSLVYAPGEKGIAHIAYLVRDAEALDAVERRLVETGIPVERLRPDSIWRGGPAVRVQSPAGHDVHLITGVNVPVPMAALVASTTDAPAPISFDHAAPRVVDVDAEMAFLGEVLGLKETAQVIAPGVGPVIAFFRAHTLFHCYTVVRGSANGLHHFQLTLKNAPAVHAAYQRMREGGAVELVWGPVRHGPGHNVAYYFRDYDGHFVEYSAEEEVILEDSSYVVQHWSAEDPKFADEWGTAPPAVFFA
jgi:catechol 2,3-dioxygenase-like lactoylglutathione lyase family enzyme